ncbi:MAG: hypothetical protein WD768_21460 [Phycisphaeraceae bacterium]
MFSRLFPACIVLTVLLVFTSGALAARVAVVTMNDGKTIKGEVVEETGDSVVLLISNVRTPLKRSDIKSVEFVKSVKEEYEIRRAQVADDNIDERLKLARWLYDSKEYALAKIELDDLAKRAKDNTTVQFLHRLVNEKIKIDNKDPVPVGPNDPVNPKIDVPGALPTKRLTEGDINTIRVYELDESKDPRVIIPPKVLDKFMEEFANDEKMPRGARDRAKFKASKGLDQLKMMFELGARQYYSDVIVRDDPPAIREFRNLHRNYVLAYCATAECHGGANAGKLFLFTGQPTSDETVHTNFYSLTQFSTKSAYMIDRDFPEKSLIVQFGLPRDRAIFPHPDVQGWKASMVRGDKDPTHNLLVEWLKGLYRPTPKYGISYAVPTVASPVKAPAPKAPDIPAPK